MGLTTEYKEMCFLFVRNVPPFRYIVACFCGWLESGQCFSKARARRQAPGRAFANNVGHTRNGEVGQGDLQRADFPLKVVERSVLFHVPPILEQYPKPR